MYNSANIESDGGDGDTTGGNGNCVAVYPVDDTQDFGDTGTHSVDGGIIGGTDGDIHDYTTVSVGTCNTAGI